ncbi:MAG: molybdopterin-guanine dinucleotide biosynthesis protein B [Hyphomicrobiaceae bacterium]
MTDPMNRTPITHAPSGAPLIGIVGWKKSGKTTLTVRLVEEFTRRGLRVATVKHAHHSFRIDDEETDSARHRRAGAGQVAIVSSQRWAVVTELAGVAEPDFADVIATLAPADLIIVEGYKSAPIRKIEARRQGAFERRPLAEGDPLIVAVAADHDPADRRLPWFSLDAITDIADFITATLAVAPSRTERRDPADAPPRR